MRGVWGRRCSLPAVRFLLSLSRSCAALSLGVAGNRTAAGSERQRTVAVVVTGLFDRLVLPPLLKSVVMPLVSKGHVVHVFMSLTRNPASEVTWETKEGHFTGEPMLANASRHEQEARLRDLLLGAGGIPSFVEIRQNSHPIDEIPHWVTNKKRLNQYSPYSTEVGRNVLRKWKSLSCLWDKILEKIESDQSLTFDWVIQLREDLYFAHPFDLHLLERDREVSGLDKVVYGMDCGSYDGINDKFMVMSREAAGVMFTRPYNAFYDPDFVVGNFVANAETWLSVVAIKNFVNIAEVPLSIYYGDSAMYCDTQWGSCLCMRKDLRDLGDRFSCRDEINMLDTVPPPCKDIENLTPGQSAGAYYTCKTVSM
mmetsp:Transcript_79568/g.179483  ORF Transcript_79568/g.179483 Transcript_79568/m.179483 type:complete len:368 (-) Transcript_79568:205-1308(-)